MVISQTDIMARYVLSESRKRFDDGLKIPPFDDISYTIHEVDC